MNKWEDYVTEIKPESHKKLNDCVAVDDFRDSKKTKAFRLSKNGENTNIFENVNNRIENQLFNNNNNQRNVIHINNNENNNMRDPE